MRFPAALFALALVVAACGGSASTGASSSVAVASTSSSAAPSTVATTGAPSTVTTMAADTSLEDYAAARQALLEFIAENSVAATPVAVGTLLESGAFADEFEPGSIPEIDLDVRFLVDLEGVVWFVVLGELEYLANTWIEFDGIAADGFTVVAETSVVAMGEGPPWVETAPAGSVVNLDPPALGSVSGLLNRGLADLDGYLLPGEIQEIDGAYLPRNMNGDAEPVDILSGWVYYDLRDLFIKSLSSPLARWVYLHFSDRVVTFPKRSDVAGQVETYRGAVTDAAAGSPVAQVLERTFGSDGTTFFVEGTLPDD